MWAEGEKVTDKAFVVHVFRIIDKWIYRRTIFITYLYIDKFMC